MLSRIEFKKPVGKARNVRDRDIDDEYAAWGWEQAERANEEEWYEQEDGTYDEEIERKKIYETEKTRNLEAELEIRLAKGHSKKYDKNLSE